MRQKTDFKLFYSLVSLPLKNVVCEVDKVVIHDHLEMPLSRSMSEELQIIKDG